MAEQQPSVIHLANVSKRFGDVTAVNDVTLRVERGQIVGFVGPNGAGKTTTISMLMGFIRPSAGRVTVFRDQIVTPESAHRTHRRIGYIAGDMQLPDHLTGEQYLRFAARRYGADPKVYDELCAQLRPQLTPRFKQLSRGNKQKIALIAALQHRPQLIILDEPTSGLDPLMQQTFLDIIKQAANDGATVFLSSHILSEVASVCDRIVFMKQGRIVSDNTTEAIEQKAGKIIDITAHPPVLAELKRTVPKSCALLAETEGGLRLRHDGDIRVVLRWLATKNVDDVTIENRELDDIFHDLYRETEEKAP